MISFFLGFLVIVITILFAAIFESKFTQAQSEHSVNNVGTVESKISNVTLLNVNSTEFQEYNDEDFGLQIQYPSEWKVKTKDLGGDLVAFSPSDKNITVLVIVIPREKHETLKQFGDRFFKNKDYFRISEYYRNASTTFAGLPAIKTSGTAYFTPTELERQSGKQSYVNEVQYVVSLVENKDAFVGVVYWALERSDFKDFLPYVEKMINSVKLTTRGPIFQEED